MIILKNVNKHFRVPTERKTTLKEFFTSPFRSSNYQKFHALKSINLHIKAGETIGIIGANGSGKSTLLKILAGIYHPDSGDAQVNGTISPLLELGIGFNNELSARNNVFLNATIIGIPQAQIKKLYPQIVEFAGLEKFMNMKIKNFSSGMRMRLAFAIASQVEADIYLCDEVLAVGDNEFQQKSLQTFNNLKDAGKTIVLVTHDLATAQHYCDRLILISKGQITAEGKPAEVVRFYQQ